MQRLCVAAEVFEKELAAHARPIGRLEGDDKDQTKPEAKGQTKQKKKNQAD